MMKDFHALANTVGVVAIPLLLYFFYGAQALKQIEHNEEAIASIAQYDDMALSSRVNKLEEAQLDSQVKLLIQKVDAIKTYDPTEAEKNINEIKVDLAKLQTTVEGLKEHDHNGTYQRREDK